MTLSHSFGVGNNAFLGNFKPVFQGDACGFNVTGEVESMDLLTFSTDANSMLTCPSELKRFGDGEKGDTGKLLCEADLLFSLPDCVIYSLGSNNQWEFEIAISKASPHCQIFTFDCTSNPPPTPIERVTFEPVCLGRVSEVIDNRHYHSLKYLMKKHNHSSVSLLKMDIEGFEMDVFNDILTVPFSPTLPYQISFETHTWHYLPTTALQHMALFQQLTFAGYRFVSRENNVQCPSCNEHTMIRVYC